MQTYQDLKQRIAMDSVYIVTVYLQVLHKHNLINFGTKRNTALGAFFFNCEKKDTPLKGGGKLFHITKPANVAVLLPYCVVFTLEIKMFPLEGPRVK